MKAVGCVIPTHNRPVSAARAIRSALQQSHPMARVVVVDDGSSPALALPDDLLADSRVVLLRNARALGRGAARNIGLRALDTPLVAFLDDDDEWHPQKTAIQLKSLERGDPAVVAIGAAYRLRTDPPCVVRPRGYDIPKAGLLTDFGLCTSTVIARRAEILAAGGFNEQLSRCEDWDLWLRLADRFKLTAVPDLLVDREYNAVAPLELLQAWVAIRRELRPRVDQLSPSDRRRVVADHDFMEGVHRARVGQRRQAFALLGRAWLGDPRRIRSLLHLARLMAGERLWELAARAVQRAGPGANRSIGFPGKLDESTPSDVRIVGATSTS
jgi:glycosyltransferase involved in cell wall biosynthesis